MSTLPKIADDAEYSAAVEKLRTLETERDAHGATLEDLRRRISGADRGSPAEALAEEILAGKAPEPAPSRAQLEERARAEERVLEGYAVAIRKQSEIVDETYRAAVPRILATIEPVLAGRRDAVLEAARALGAAIVAERGLVAELAANGLRFVGFNGSPAEPPFAHVLLSWIAEKVPASPSGADSRLQ